MSEFTSQPPNQSPKIAFIHEYVDIPAQVDEKERVEVTTKFKSLADELILNYIQILQPTSLHAHVPMNRIVLDVPTPTELWTVAVESLASEQGSDVTDHFPKGNLSFGW